MICVKFHVPVAGRQCIDFAGPGIRYAAHASSLPLYQIVCDLLELCANGHDQTVCGAAPLFPCVIECITKFTAQTGRGSGSPVANKRTVAECGHQCGLSGLRSACKRDAIAGDDRALDGVCFPGGFLKFGALRFDLGPLGTVQKPEAFEQQQNACGHSHCGTEGQKQPEEKTAVHHDTSSSVICDAASSSRLPCRVGIVLHSNRVIAAQEQMKLLPPAPRKGNCTPMRSRLAVENKLTSPANPTAQPAPVPTQLSQPPQRVLSSKLANISKNVPNRARRRQIQPPLFASVAKIKSESATGVLTR